ncbi:enoyl-CoA hydratase-related protein [Rhodobacter sp. 24-YEA-8]|uniref:enoyl-CoA hydratase-related protein n=1 Tax=Rhodobacter sp. 24-YEA-8 TaxID=1884310 RepID=UPI000896BEB5|nr:enoyl-CoA hydratase-related protein [Rhodobacter sp. 24-YEA-8]SED64535.1 short chain enoyl-CoA hydratase [Rhodobacter sp. 24-YEA-8]
MTQETILTETHGRVRLIRLNRPGALNALNRQLSHDIIRAAVEAEADPAIGCIVLTGSERAFAAGADIAEMAGMSAGDMAAQDWFGEWDAFTRLKKPRLAAVNGYALGGGCELMMMCDFAIAGAGAKFGQPEIRLGVIAGIGGTQRMTRLIGRALAMDMHLTGRMMDAPEALRAGLIARVVPDGEVLPATLSAAAMIASHSAPALRLAREAVARAEELSLAEGVLFERRIFHSLFGSPDQQEGMRAFLEKRAPAFKSN